jgi:integrase
MSVHRVKSTDRWFVKLPKGTRPTKKYFGRGEEARQAAEAYDASVKARADKTGVSFVTLAELYYESLQARCQPSTISTRFNKLSSVIVPHFADSLASSIDHAALDRYVRHRQRSCKNSTIRTELGIIHAVLNHAQRSGKVITNPAHGYRPPRDDVERIRPPTEQEFIALVKHAAPHLQRILWIGWYTGARIGKVETYSLLWSSVDLQAGVLTIRGARKGGAAYRDVPIAAPLLEMMREWIKDGSMHVVHFRGKPIENIGGAWRRAKERAKISRRLRPYDLRHSAASRMLEAGADLGSVASLLGNSPTMVLKTYQHLVNQQKVDAISKLGTLSSTQQEEKVQG